MICQQCQGTEKQCTKQN